MYLKTLNIEELNVCYQLSCLYMKNLNNSLTRSSRGIINIYIDFCKLYNKLFV